MARRGAAADRGVEPPSGTDHPPPKLVLASEALREDLAPTEPGRITGRRCVLGVALSLALLGLALQHGVGANPSARESGSVAFAAAGAIVAVALLPFGYALRAGVTAVLGAILVLLGSDAVGPLSGLGWRSGSVDFERLLVLATLPAALLFRARYRAYIRARLVLGLALAAAVPFVVSRAGLALGSTTGLLDRVGAAMDVIVILLALFGFMGSYTTGGGAVWAALVLGVLPADVALREFSPELNPGAGVLASAGAAVAMICAGILLTTGIYHLLAASLGHDARRDARKKAGAPSLA
ncbi:MAG TPA: hypothetical protein VH142_07310 [Polyangiaceae bacterium]|jgi:hypothetical protein|nr:hypothetical protein [Polyangiaceae bacterium]